MTDEELEVAIARYRVELIEEAGLARGDLDELEDHLRALIEELRAAGESAQVAFVEATRRLGQPRALARELARTRPVFGARPSRAAAWSVVALQVCWLVMSVITMVEHDVGFAWWLSPWTVMSMVATVGLAFRTSWARVIFVGNAALGLLGSVELLAAIDDVPARFVLLGIAFNVGVLAFLAPMRGRGRGLTARGWALVLALAGTGGVNVASQILISPLGDGVIVPYLFGIAGILLCARWATPALLAVAAVLVAATPYLPVGASSHAYTTFAWHFVSTAAVIAAALLARRGARGAGSLRALAR